MIDVGRNSQESTRDQNLTFEELKSLELRVKQATNVGYIILGFSKPPTIYYKTIAKNNHERLLN